MKNKKWISLMILAAIGLSGCSTASSESAKKETETKQPKYVFYFIGDGMGASHRGLAENYMQWKNQDTNYKLSMNQMPVTANVTTNSLSSTITDSAAAGTALSTGIKTATGVIGMDEKGKDNYTTILESMQKDGYGVGMATTVSITHATPAAFGAHVPDRNDEVTIADQYLKADYDYLAGGGAQYFQTKDAGGKREDGKDLAKAFGEQGYDVDSSLKDFEETDFTKTDKYLGIYEPKYLTDVITQKNVEKTSPTLAEMVKGGIDVLSQNDKGFFMMVEGGYIDGAAHNNDTPAVLNEVLSFEESVAEAKKFYDKHPDETLILVTADHETGGLSLGYNSYKMDFEAIDRVKSSFGNTMESYIEKKDYDGLYQTMEKEWQVKLSDDEKALVQNRLNTFPIADLMADMGIPESEKEKAEGMKHMMGIGGYAASPILSKETKIAWTTQAHTAETVPLTAIGVGSKDFGECEDNTDIPQTLAEIMDVKIGK
ncbi:alkaline phosphatase [Enterococcus devriesei]|uniref:alkaline phosphatase n=1 Tax=Enterococcus devriesei TaxID=319970 RepID=UPI0036D21335